MFREDGPTHVPAGSDRSEWAQHLAPRWRDVLAMGDPPPEVRARVDAWLGDDPALGRAAVRALAVAGLAGGKGVALAGDAALRIADAAGRPAVLVPLAFALPAAEAGAPEDVGRLIRAVEGALGRWRFVMHLRRPLPAGFDPAAVAQAVHLWRMAMDRGEWRGRHAVYEDDTVSVDIAVTTASEREDGGGALVSVPPLPAPDRIGRVYAQVIAALHGLEEPAGDLPVVFALSAEPGWRLPRGYVSELLYGMPDRISAERHAGGFRYEAEHRATGVSMFSDPICRRVAAAWWLEGGEALRTRGHAHENPWCEAELSLPFPGVRFAVIDRGWSRSSPERNAAVLAWEGHGHTEWGTP